MRIEFTGEYQWNIDGWIAFRALLDGQEITNRISRESLQDYFESDGSRAGDEAAYVRHRSRIDPIAAVMMQAEVTNEHGGADLTTEMVERYGPETL